MVTVLCKLAGEHVFDPNFPYYTSIRVFSYIQTLFFVLVVC